MNANQLLKQDHDKVKQIFQQYRQGGAGGGTQHQQLVQQACQELFVHSEIEKQVYYPAIEQSGDSEIRNLVQEGRREHQQVDQLVQQLMTTGGQSPQQMEPMFQQLMQSVEHHVQEEEQQMFPLVQQVCGPQLDQIGQQLQQRKQQLLATMPTA